MEGLDDLHGSFHFWTVLHTKPSGVYNRSEPAAEYESVAGSIVMNPVFVVNVESGRI